MDKYLSSDLACEKFDSKFHILVLQKDEGDNLSHIKVMSFDRTDIICLFLPP